MQPYETPNETATPRSTHDRLPVEVSLTIICAGVVGLIMPGPFGAPLIVGGGLSLWPRAFRPIDRWVERRMPKSHASGTKWLDRFQTDLERRYPSHRTIARHDETTCSSNGLSSHGC